MTKLTIEYYKLDFEIDGQLVIGSPDDNDEIKTNYWEKLIKEAYKHINDESSTYYLIDDSDKFIEFLEANDDYIFGILGKSDSLTPGTLRRVKNKEKVDVSELYLEKYNYFYLRKKDYSVNVIRNSQSPGFKKPFRDLLKNIKVERIKSIDVIRILDKNIKSKLNKIQEILNISMIFNQDSNTGDELLSLDDSFNLSNNNLIRANIRLDFKKQTISQDTKDLLTNDDKIKSDFEKLKIIGKGPLGEETIDVVDKWLIKSVEIELSDEDLINDNLDKIKEALKESFLN